MKLVLLLSSCLAVTAFGVNPSRPLGGPALVVKTQDKAVTTPLFRDPTVTRGGAVPGWAAYNDALDKKPLITKAMTSLVGWALGDLLAQVSWRWTGFVYLSACLPSCLDVCLSSCKSTRDGALSAFSLFSLRFPLFPLTTLRSYLSSFTFAFSIFYSIL
jgi:hypothetical protein